MKLSWLDCIVSSLLLSVHNMDLSWLTGPVSPHWQGIGTTGERSCYNRMVIHVQRGRSITEIPPDPLSEANGEQAVDDRVQAGVHEPEDEQNVGQ